MHVVFAAKNSFVKFIEEIPPQGTLFKVDLFHDHWLNVYRSRTKLREGNVFTSVCLSMGGGVSQHALGPEVCGWGLYTPAHTPATASVTGVRILLECILVSLFTRTWVFLALHKIGEAFQSQDCHHVDVLWLLVVIDGCSIGVFPICHVLLEPYRSKIRCTANEITEYDKIKEYIFGRVKN